ncbi:uncharacterized protein PAC_11504 [Phialocephala subalpina]|uniref:Peptidase S1 domain-containing protein n=1 Tax=Phialocephala subalpina TaxID=576137 RepID=A0A1L7X9F3_9HELO|nr:uncharacterized protein PAC_11504 [Phialocephala subalpina]
MVLTYQKFGWKLQDSDGRTSLARHSVKGLSQNGYYQNYYAGRLLRNARLVAQGNKLVLSPPTLLDPYGAEGRIPASKKAFAQLVGHPIAQKLEHGLRVQILQILVSINPNKWISLDFLSIGYDEVAKNNPVVILVSVEKDQVSLREGKRIVGLIERACAEASLFDVEPEIIEGHRCHNPGLREWEALPYRQPDIPLVGSSIALSGENHNIKVGTGSLGGYVLVDGKKYGLTCHHVCFGRNRMESYPSRSEAASATKYKIGQPAPLDLEQTIYFMKIELEEWRLIDRTEKYPRSSKPARSHGKMGVHQYMEMKETKDAQCFYDATELEGRHLERMDWPLHLKRGLSFDEACNKCNSAASKDKSYVVWKLGRTTHFTCGIVSGVRSNYQFSNENIKFVSDEWMVMNRATGIHNNMINIFSDGGDSGSFVYIRDGYVAGMLWKEATEDLFTYVTPIEAVFEDIKSVCKATDVLHSWW